MNKMSLDYTISAYFVTTSPHGHKDSECEAFKDINAAINFLKQHISEGSIRQIQANEGFPLIASGKLTKKDVFIFDRFEGDFFRQLQQTKSLIIGPPCLITCLQNKEPIPLGTSPVYTNAMHYVNISASGVAPAEKDRLKVLIEWMGGHYFQHLGKSVTHLISNTIKSSKYEYATLNGIPVMHIDWVQRVWEKSSAQYNIKATDSEFDKYKLPIFYGVNVTCTSLKTDKKNEIMRLVNENGGTYHGMFRPQFIDIVITEKNKSESEKYQAAIRFKKDILTPEWIFDSVERGFALPVKSYEVKSLKVSTPTKSDQTVPDFTMSDNTQMSDISRIGGVSSEETTVNDTVSSSMNQTQKSTPTIVASVSSAKSLKENVLKKKIAGMHYQKIYEDISPNKAKKAGNFLDGCSVYLSGFRTEEKEKLNRILNVGGATRYDVLNEMITHIIVGQLLDTEFNAWKKLSFFSTVHIVRLDWLLESIELKHPANEAVHRVLLPTSGEPDAPSPSSKRTLRSMNHSFKQPAEPIRRKLFNPDTMKSNGAKLSQSNLLLENPLASSTEMPLGVEEENLIAQYSKENQPAASVSSLNISNVGNKDNQIKVLPSNETLVGKAAPAIPLNSSETGQGSQLTIDYENLNFFRGMSLYVDRNHFPEDFYTNLVTECEAVHGTVVAANFSDPVDYAIVSFEHTFNPKSLPVIAKQIITELYVESCMKHNQLVPVEYYHKYIPHTADTKPLIGMTVVVSTYSDLERDFIDSIAQLLGASVNKTFVKKERPLLVCPSPKGNKYEGAIKWNYPVVTSEWLIQCAQQGIKLPYKDYLVEGSPLDFPISPTLPQGNVIAHTKSITEQKNNGSALPGIEMNELDCQMAGINGIDENTPLRNKRVSELAGKSHKAKTLNVSTSSANSNSPHTPLNRPSYNFHFLEKILAEIEDDDERQCLKEVLEEMRTNHTPELERIKRQACTPVRVPTPKGIPDFCQTPEFEKRMADEFERRWRLPTKKMKADTPIDVIRRRVLRATCKAMGIPFNYDEDLQNKDQHNKIMKNDFNKPTREISTCKQPLEVPSIVNENAHENSENITHRRSSILVPDTQSPYGLGKRASLNNKSTLNFDKITFNESTTMVDNDDADANSGNGSISQGIVSNRTNQQQTSAAKDTPEVKQITEFLKNCETRRRSLKRGLQNNGSPTATETDMIATQSYYVQPFESEKLQSEEMVGWRDPADFVNQRRSKPKETTMQYLGVPRFSISCADENIKEDIIDKILQLGGEVCSNLINYDPECTHFLIERPNRAEKMLGCISSGKWILSHDYIEQCYAKGVFIDEELYEWGNCKALNLPHLSSEEQVIALAAHRWRKTLSCHSAESKGAFNEFRVILHMTGRNVEALKNVVRAGKGIVLETIPPYKRCAETKTATHCFVDSKKSPLNKDDLDYFKRHNILVLTQMYINAYLMNGPDVDLTKYEIH